MADSFRAGTDALIIAADGRVMVFQRSGDRRGWQFPQGGLDPGETPLDGVWREVGEETGLGREELELLAAAPDWMAYEYPESIRAAKGQRGQVQRWFAFRFRGRDADIDLAAAADDEFRDWRWMTMADATAAVIPFKRDLYRRLAVEFCAHLKAGAAPADDEGNPGRRTS